MPVLHDDERDPLDDRIRELAREYHRPAGDAARGDVAGDLGPAAGLGLDGRPRPRWVPWAAAAAAVLAVGIGIGRMSVPEVEPSGALGGQPWPMRRA